MRTRNTYFTSPPRPFTMSDSDNSMDDDLLLTLTEEAPTSDFPSPYSRKYWAPACAQLRRTAQENKGCATTMLTSLTISSVMKRYPNEDLKKLLATIAQVAAQFDIDRESSFEFAIACQAAAWHPVDHAHERQHHLAMLQTKERETTQQKLFTTLLTNATSPSRDTSSKGKKQRKKKKKKPATASTSSAVAAPKAAAATVAKASKSSTLPPSVGGQGT